MSVSPFAATYRHGGSAATSTAGTLVLVPRRRVVPELVAKPFPRGTELDFFDPSRYPFGTRPDSRDTSVDEYEIRVEIAPPGTYTAADIGLSDLDDNPTVFLAHVPAWVGVENYALDPDRALNLTRSILAALIAEGIREGCPLPEPTAGADPWRRRRTPHTEDHSSRLW